MHSVINYSISPSFNNGSGLRLRVVIGGNSLGDFFNFSNFILPLRLLHLTQVTGVMAFDFERQLAAILWETF